MADRVERELRDVHRAQAGRREARREQRAVAPVEPLVHLPRRRLVVEGDVVRHGHHQEALLRQELQEMAVGDLGDGADEGAAEELDDGERAAAARRRREDEAGVFPQVRPPPRLHPGGSSSGSGEPGERAIGAKRCAAGEGCDAFGPVGAEDAGMGRGVYWRGGGRGG